MDDKANFLELKAKDYKLLNKVATVDLLGLHDTSYDAGKDVTINFDESKKPSTFMETFGQSSIVAITPGIVTSKQNSFALVDRNKAEFKDHV